MSDNRVVIAADKQALTDLRTQIDQIDIALHDLLRERAEIIEQVRKVKGKQAIFLRPGREASMLRALMKRPQGKLPEGLVVRIWREMISAFTLMEGNFKVAVYTNDKGDDLWDVARDHFGAFTPLIEVKSAQDAIAAVQDGKATLAIVPPPQEAGKDTWWQTLATDPENTITVFAALPFEVVKTGRSNARHALPTGLILGRLYPELTGDDRSLLALQCVHVPEAEMKRLISKAGYKLRQMLAQTMGRGASAPTLFTLEVDGFPGRNDTRVSRLRAMLGSRLRHISLLGGYPVPMKAGKK